jgi:hypothetical protein
MTITAHTLGVLLLALATVACAISLLMDEPAPRWLIFTVLLGGGLVIAGCGGNASTATLSPEQVAREYVTAAYRCGEAGAGRAYDLSTSSARTWPRSKFISEEARHGCRPQPIPTLRILRGKSTTYKAVIGVEVIPNPSTTEGRGVLVLELRRFGGDDSWLVDTQASTDPEWLTTS